MDSSSPAETTAYASCTHLAQLLASSSRDNALNAYGFGVQVAMLNYHLSSHGHQYFSSSGKSGTARSSVDSTKLLSLQAKALRCRECNIYSENSFMCLQCPHVGCWSRRHAASHFKTSNHCFGIDARLGTLYCFKCDDYVGDPRLEAVRAAKLRRSCKCRFRSSPLAALPAPPVDPAADKLIAAHSRVPSFKASTGLRGFYNMGSTCFMAVILQTFIHNPFIRNYFLSGGYETCEADSCLSCCLEEIFVEFYTSDQTGGFGPTALLVGAWKTKRFLAGSSEQDAHEFWQLLLNELHLKAESHRVRGFLPEPNAEENSELKTDPKSDLPTEFHCPCIVHRTFLGGLLSTVTCENCHAVTRKIDPMLDINLEIGQLVGTSEVTLEDCLKKFTATESLGSAYKCGVCFLKGRCAKQLGICRLPNVLTIQLKRFRHFGSTSAKIDDFIRFPLFLDMAPYVTKQNAQAADCKYIYELFGVVCHQGSVNTGHYSCFIKTQQGQWFQFNDAQVTATTTERVVAAKAYLLFYIVHDVAVTRGAQV